MVFDFDLRLFCENLKATKPPYECPAPGCGRVYKTYIGIQFHLFNYNHENPDGKSSSTPGNGDQTKQPNSSKKGHHRQVRCSLSPSHVSHDESEHDLSSLSLSPHNVSSKSQRIVEINLDGRVHRVDVYEAMNVVVRQSHVSATENVDTNTSEQVICTTLSTKTPSDEPVSGVPVIGNSVHVEDVTDTCSLLPDDAVGTSDSLEIGSKHDTEKNVVTFGSDAEKAEAVCEDESCNDVKTVDVNKTTSDAGPGASCHLPLSVSNLCAINSNNSYDSVIGNTLDGEVKTETDHEQFVESTPYCTQKNTSCSDDTTVILSSSEFVNTSIVSTECVQTAECDVVKSCDTISSSTAVISKSAPTKLSLPSAEFKLLSDYLLPPKIVATALKPEYYKFTERTAEELDAVIEYDMDEEVYVIIYAILHYLCNFTVFYITE